MKKTIGNYKGDNLYLIISSYKNNGRIYLGIETEDELYDDITINLSDRSLYSNDTVFVNNDMTQDMRSFLEKKGIIGKTIDVTYYNMGKYDLVKVNFDKLKQYDPDGFKEYEKHKKSLEDYEL